MKSDIKDLSSYRKLQKFIKSYRELFTDEYFEFQENWIKALRSGEFQQGKIYLLDSNDEKKYCCMGVAARCLKILDYDIIDQKFLREYSIEGYQKIPEVLYHKYYDRIGMNPFPSLLSIMNDQNDMSFLEIADWLEENITKEKIHES